MEKYDIYIQLENEKKLIEEKIKALREEILSEMVNSGQQKINTGAATFSIRKLKKLIYPEHIRIMEEEVKTQKAIAEENGEVEVEEKDSLFVKKVSL